jgi:molybdate transport system permease protein
MRLVALPIVLPPSVLGFYLLIVMSPNGIIGKITQQLGIGTLPFTFRRFSRCLRFIFLAICGATIAKHLLQRSVTRRLEAAATLRASPLDTFFSVVMPLSKSGFLTAAILGFTHTVGEFGVVLMVGGNIPDKTRVVSVQIYNHVEALEYESSARISRWIADIFIFNSCYCSIAHKKTVR